MSRTAIEADGKRLLLSNLEKQLYPADGLTKAGVLDYYRRMADVIVPHLKDRALTLKRYPDGVAGGSFFEKRCPVYRPDWVPTAVVRLESEEPMTVCLVNDLATLLWAENLASLELHVPLARVNDPDRPDALVFDLDPGEPAGGVECARVALVLRQLLERMGLESLVKTSGRKGLHVLVPLNRAGTTFADTKTFSRAVASLMQKHYRDLVTSRVSKEERRGKVLINWSQNDAKKTMVAVYSLRAGEHATVSFPLGWRDVEDAARSGDAGRFRVMPADAVDRIAQEGDRFRDLLVKEQRLPHL